MPPRVCLTILGSGTAVPTRSRAAPGLAVAVDTEERSYLALLDPGAGSTQRLVIAGHDLERLTHVLVTHEHPDHTGDLVPLLFALGNPRYAAVGRREPVHVSGPRGLRRLLSRLGEVYGSWIDLGPRIEVRDLEPGDRDAFLTIGPVEVTWFPVRHTDTSVAYRLELRDGRVLAYSGDTDVCDGIVEAARNADLLVLECAFPEGQKHDGHLVPSEAGRIAAAANVRTLVLTHFYPECEGHDLLGPCREVFSGDVRLAEDGFTVNL